LVSGSWFLLFGYPIISESSVYSVDKSVQSFLGSSKNLSTDDADYADDKKDNQKPETKNQKPEPETNTLLRIH
jgi:hypothetical protein